MTVLTQENKTQSTAFEAMIDQTASVGEDWLQSLKAKAAERYRALGLPTTKHEDWRYTNLAPIREADFNLAATPGRCAADDVGAFAIPDLAGSIAVFVDGHFSPELSALGSLPHGARAVPIRDAIVGDRQLVEKHLGRIADFENDAFTALNTACIDDGLFIHIAAGVVVDQPIRILNIATADAELVATHPRNLILAEKGSKVTVVEQYVAQAETIYLTNAVTEIEAEAEAEVIHYILEEESEKAFNISTLAFHQHDKSDVHSHTMMFGGAIVRNNVNPQMDGEYCICLINGMYAPKGTQHVDNLMRVEHRKPHGDSRQFYKGVLLDEGSAVFSGRIIVSPGAQKTDAKQTNANLLLSDDARINTKPQLEIYADDVKCTHGATIGQLDDDAVFYLESRGISKEAARGLMVYSFAAETFERIECEPIRKYLEQRLIKRLPQGHLLENVL